MSADVQEQVHTWVKVGSYSWRLRTRWKSCSFSAAGSMSFRPNQLCGLVSSSQSIKICFVYFAQLLNDIWGRVHCFVAHLCSYCPHLTLIIGFECFLGLDMFLLTLPCCHRFSFSTSFCRGHHSEWPHIKDLAFSFNIECHFWCNLDSNLQPQDHRLWEWPLSHHRPDQERPCTW